MRDFASDKRLCDAASICTHEGPWRAEQLDNIWFVEVGPANDKIDCFDLFEDPTKEVCEFIAAAREGWPAALARIAELEAALRSERRETVSRIRDVERRIGVACEREWIREQLDQLALKLEREP